MSTKFCGKDFLLQIGTELTAWVTATAYKVGDYVSNSGTNYICLVAHTADTFATDLSAAKWAIQATQPYVTIGGMQSNSMSINKEAVDVTDKGNMPWRELANCGITSMDMSGNGFFVNDASLKAVLAAALSGSIRLYQLISGAGDKFSGSFQIGTMERAGDHNNSETYTVSLASSGAVTYTAAP